MAGYAFVDGFTSLAPDEAVSRLKRAIAAASGVIVDFAFFGREALRLTVEVDAARLVTLGNALEADDFELFARSRAVVAEAGRAGPDRPMFALFHFAFLATDDLVEPGLSAHAAESVAGSR